MWVCDLHITFIGLRSVVNFCRMLDSEIHVFTFGFHGWFLHLLCGQLSQHYCITLTSAVSYLSLVLQLDKMHFLQDFAVRMLSSWCCAHRHNIWLVLSRKDKSYMHRHINLVSLKYVDDLGSWFEFNEFVSPLFTFKSFCWSHFSGDGPWLDFVGFVTRVYRAHKQGHDKEYEPFYFLSTHSTSIGTTYVHNFWCSWVNTVGFVVFSVGFCGSNSYLGEGQVLDGTVSFL